MTGNRNERKKERKKFSCSKHVLVPVKIALEKRSASQIEINVTACQQFVNLIFDYLLWFWQTQMWILSDSRGLLASRHVFMLINFYPFSLHRRHSEFFNSFRVSISDWKDQKSEWIAMRSDNDEFLNFELKNCEDEITRNVKILSSATIRFSFFWIFFFDSDVL